MELTDQSINVGNATCLPYNAVNAAIGYSESLKLFSLVYTIFVFLVMVVCGALWYKWRDTLYLSRRFPALVFLTSLAVLVQHLFVGPLPRALDGYYAFPCELAFGMFGLAFPAVTWPLTVRMILHHNKISYHQNLALENFEEVQVQEGYSLEESKPAREYEQSIEQQRLQRQRFATSGTYGSMITVVPLLLIAILCFTVGPGTSCYECAELPLKFWGESVVAILGASALFVVGFNAVFLFAIRKDPDPLKLAEETQYVWLVSLLVGTLGLILGYFDAGGFTKMRPIPFTFNMLLDFSGFLFFVGIVPLQLYKSSQPVRAHPGKLSEVLNDANGLHYFGLYLATELSLENLMFWMTVNKWLENYEGRSTIQHMKAAVAIYNRFIPSTAEHPINISAAVRSKIESQLFDSEEGSSSKSVNRLSSVKGSKNGSSQRRSRKWVSLLKIRSRKSFKTLEEIPSSVFNEAAQEIYILMERDSYSRFKKSVLYKQYIGIVDPIEEVANHKDTNTLIHALQLEEKGEL